jgi:superfamily I DNA/RNA helicase
MARACPTGVHVGTLHRFKGLEHQWMVLAGITDAAVPGYYIADDPVRQHRDPMRARSLLFVAATRARDALVISWHGSPAVSSARCHEEAHLPTYGRIEAWQLQRRMGQKR